VKGKLPAIVLAAVAAVYLYLARSFETGFIADPIGPKAFPYGIGILAVLSALLLLREAPSPSPTGKREPLEGPFLLRASLLTAVLLAYAAVLDTIGFIVSTTVVMTALVGLFRGRLLPGLLFGFVSSVLFFAVFTYGLSVPLPFGTVFGGR
jgi:putative tricarboxylic transport membrane protein